MIELNKIYNENNCETMAKMPNNFCHVVFTSPPYNRKRNDKYDFYTDEIKNYYEFLVKTIDECKRVSSSNVFINLMANYYNKQDIYKIIGHYSEEIAQIFVWEKSNPLPAQGNFITNAYEFILAFGKLESNKTYTKNHLTTPIAKMEKTHKAIMPDKVAEYFILNFTKERDIIYDPFMGSGTTAKVCIRTNRNYVGSEISQEYCELAEKKLKPYKQEIDMFHKVS